MRAEWVKHYKPVIRECYEADGNLVSTWHQASGKGLEACVEKEFSDLQHARVDFFKVTAGGELVGYFCKENLGDLRFLTGFFIMPRFRFDDIRAEFWKLAKSHIDSPFFCGLYEKNLPANKFIQSNGGSPVRKTFLPDGEAVLYKVV